jgi:hypothetical protein
MIFCYDSMFNMLIDCTGDEFATETFNLLEDDELVDILVSY